MNIEATVEQYILTELLNNRRTKIDPAESLVSSGLLDSLSLWQLIAFLEEEFGITVDASDMLVDNFQTINAIKAYLEGKLQAK